MKVTLRKILLTASVLFLLPFHAVSQWSQQNSGTSEMLQGVNMASADTGWAVGTNGAIRYTTDGGSNWNGQNGGTNAPLSGVDAHDGMNATSVGGFQPLGTMSGTILNTSNGGTNWNAVSSGVPYVFTDVFFIDPTEGWIVGAGGGTIYHTTNGGSSWTDQSTSGDSLFAVYFTVPSVGWVAADDGEVLSTGDGGSTWSTFSTPVTEDLRDLHFTGFSTGWAVGDNGVILKTTNGGSSWTVQNGPGGPDLYGVHFIDANEGWAVGEGGTVLHTTDGGSTWSPETSNSSEDLHSVHFPVDSIGWAAGSNGEIIVRSTGCTPTSSSIAPTACYSYTVPSGDTSYTSSGNYQDTLTQGGCDSIIDIDLTIDTVDTSVTMPSAGELEAQASGASYQWLDCDDGHTPINGATGQSFQPASSGNYAVEVSANGCTDTSSCHNVQNVGIEEEGADGQELSIAPNPTDGELQIRFGSLREDVTLRVMDLTGRVIERRHYDARSRIRYRIEGEPGLYFIELEDAKGRKQVRKIMKE